MPIEGSRLGRFAPLLVVIACAVTMQACGGSLTVLPTSPSPSPGNPVPAPTPSPVPSPSPAPAPQPQTISFDGKLADGGWFEGYITYGTRDDDSRPDTGRFLGGLWEVAVHGGSTTRDVWFGNERGGRALIETYTEPFPAMGIIVLFPREDPAVEALTPHVRPMPGYAPDTQPFRKDFGELIPGQVTEFGTFMDGTGTRTLVTSITLY